MNVENLDQDTVTLVPHNIDMEENQDLTMYLISNYQLMYRDEKRKRSGIKLEIKFKRKITNEMMTTYLPSVLLMLITYATTFFKPFYFEAALTVNLTTMLVLTTIFTAVMDKLPPTAYVKMVDVWLIIAQCYPFIEVILLTYMEYYREGDDHGEMRINHHGAERIVTVTPPSSSHKVIDVKESSETEDIVAAIESVLTNSKEEGKVTYSMGTRVITLQLNF